MTFKKIYYISDHAVSAFRERLNCDDVPTKQIRDHILSELQKETIVCYERYNHKIQPVYKGEFKGVVFHIPVQQEIKKQNAWDAVPTILLPGMKTYSRNLEMFTVEEASKKLDVSKDQVMHFLREGRLKFDPNITNCIKIYKLDVRRLNSELKQEKVKNLTL